MVEWLLEQTDDFEKEFNKLIPKNMRDKVKSQILKLKDNPFVGKPLGFKFLERKNLINGEFIILFMKIKLLFILLVLVIKNYNNKE